MPISYPKPERHEPPIMRAAAPAARPAASPKGHAGKAIFPGEQKYAYAGEVPGRTVDGDSS